MSITSCNFYNQQDRTISVIGIDDALERSRSGQSEFYCIGCKQQLRPHGQHSKKSGRFSPMRHFEHVTANPDCGYEN
jgi:hypothetical protein